MTETHIIRTPYSDRSLCGAAWENAEILSGTPDLKKVDCTACREKAGLKDVTVRHIYRYKLSITVSKEISWKDMEYLESHVESFLATRYRGEVSINSDFETLDADEEGCEHLLDEG